MASGVKRDIANKLATLSSLGILLCELWYMIVCGTPQIALNAVQETLLPVLLPSFIERKSQTEKLQCFR